MAGGENEGPEAEVRAAVAELPVWRHRIAVGHGVVTPGSEDCATEVQRLELPADLTAKRVLDVGCSDGYYSFVCEERGATEVLAIDDMSSRMNVGRNGFQIAGELRESRARFEAKSIYELDPTSHGRFDVVLLLNVLYHLKHPLLALEKLAAGPSPRGELYLKSYFGQGVRVWCKGKAYGFDWGRQPKLWFYPGGDLAGDPTNWCAPNKACLDALLETAGFSMVEHLREVGDRAYIRARRSGHS